MSDSYDDFDRALLRAGRTAKAPSSLRAKALAAAAAGTATAAATTKLGVGAAKASGGIAAQAAHAFGLKAVLVASIGVTSVAFVLGGAYVAASRHADAVASAAPVRSPRAASPRAAEIGEVTPAAALPTQEATQEATQEQPALPAKAEPAAEPAPLAAASPAPRAAASPAPRAAASIKDVAPAPQGTGLARQVPSSAPSVTAVPAVDPLPREPSSEQAAPAPATPTFVLSDELRLIDAARAALARGDAPLALRFTAEHAARFPGGSLAIERDVLRVDALVAAGHIAEAASHACAFAARSPRSAQAPRMIKVGRCSSTIP
ncbi:hypothetical protein [Sorangium sp. So ce513]|uniref:hypothetical protein n=1 Tax=Sorangium sp. So ce513 TaxID=3133315 RepID=UPI003F615A78